MAMMFFVLTISILSVTVSYHIFTSPALFHQSVRYFSKLSMCNQQIISPFENGKATSISTEDSVRFRLDKLN